MHLRYYLIWLLAFTPWLVRRCSTSEILMVTMAGTKSHKMPFWALSKALIERNHSITFISPFPPEFSLPGLQEIAPSKMVEYNRDFNNRDLLGARLKGAQPFPLLEMIGYPVEMCSSLLESDEVQELIHSGKRYDLLIIDSTFPDCIMGLVDFYKVPFIYLNAVPFYTFQLSISGSPVMYSVTPFFLRPYTEDMSLVERTINAAYYIFSDIVHPISTNLFLQKVLRKHFGPFVPNVVDLRKNVSFVLQNGHYSVSYPRPYLPNVAEIACMHCRSAQPLNKEMEDFINKGGENGFILVSMGSGVKSSGMPVELREVMLKTFSKLPQQILWKWEDDSKIIPDMPKNIMLSQWLPQQDLLGHKKIRAFVTQCGIQSLFESVYHGVPVVAMPVFADQESNSIKAQSDGYCIVQDARTLKSQDLLKAITEVIHNPKYRKEVKRRQILLRDQKEEPVERAVFWTEYVIRHRGAKHLMSPSRNMNFIQYFSIDSFAILIFIGLFLIYAFGWLLKTALGCLFCKWGSTSEKTKKD